MKLLVFALACVAGQFLQTTIGFGLNVLVMAVATALFPVTTLASVCTLLSLGSCTYFMVRWRKKIRVRVILLPLAAMLATSVLAIRTIRYIPVSALRGLLGLALMAMSVFLLTSRRRAAAHPAPVRGLLSGTAAGILAGYFSIGGPPLVAYLLRALDDKETYLACIQTCFFVSNLWLTAFRGAAGYLNREVAWLCLLGYAFVAAGAYLGVKLLHRLNFERLRTLAYGFIGICGAWTAVDTWLLH